MKVSSRVSESDWSSGSLLRLSESDLLHTECIVSKTKLLLKHIEVFREELVEVSAMVQDLEQLLAALSSIIKMKKPGVT